MYHRFKCDYNFSIYKKLPKLFLFAPSIIYLFASSIVYLIPSKTI